MIVYDTKNWSTTLIKVYLSFNKAFTTRVLFKYILYVTLYTTLIVVVDIEMLTEHYEINPIFFSLLGVILSLMLVFRLNTGYDRWWEARKAWGSLINTCRTLASIYNILLPKEDKLTRKKVAALISNFPLALQAHLRANFQSKEFEEMDEPLVELIQKTQNLPHQIASRLFTFTKAKLDAGEFSQWDFLLLKPQLDALIDILGICERIKNTPIPFSHSSYIKTFILVYTLALPFGIVRTLLYYTIPTVALISYALIGVEVISEEIEEPFGTEANDLPLLHFSKVIKENVYEVLEVSYSKSIDSLAVDNKLIQIIR